MDNIKNDMYFLNKMKADMSFIMNHMKNTDETALNQNEILLDSMLFRLIQISENARKTSDLFRESHPHIPWTAIFGLRNRIVHDYGNVDLGIIFATLTNDIPELLSIINGEINAE